MTVFDIDNYIQVIKIFYVLTQNISATILPSSGVRPLSKVLHSSSL
jgi:hypothetical protein